MPIWKSAAAAALVMAAGSAEAAAVFAFRDVGFSVVGTLSGSLDLGGAASSPDEAFGAEISIVFAILSSGPGQSSPIPFASYGVSGPTIWGSGGLTGGKATGDAVQIMARAGLLSLPKSYSGGPLNGQITFANTLIDDFGLVADSFTYRLTGSQDTFTVTFDKRQPPAPVPLPAGLPVLLTGLALLALSTRRRRQGGRPPRKEWSPSDPPRTGNGD